LHDSAAIIFTTGSTGPPKGVQYTHQTFHSQIDMILEQYRIQPGGKDLSGFPLFGLFNAVMGTSTILPDMDPTRPADVDPPRLLDAIDQWQINQSFGSPALWTKMGLYCKSTGRRMESLKLVLSAGAPVPSRVLEQVRAAMHPDGKVFTPYGATEALPIASIESREVLQETSKLTNQGLGTCVGKRFAQVQWKVIEITDEPIATIEQVRQLPPGQIGELMVCSPSVTHRYVTRTDQNQLHKVLGSDPDGQPMVWHRMGDVGYLDPSDRFWFCGRKSHRVRTSRGPIFTEPIEAVLNTHPSVYRSALVPRGTSPDQKAVVIIEPWPEHRKDVQANLEIHQQQWQALISRFHPSLDIESFVVYPKRLPTDIRHNSKIFREELTDWLAKYR
jgi:acyl-CoA synthetase (AMP-forming)/AMP-acid ligase II